ncbi:MAG: transposase [Spirochaetia bacterium]|nr:transposase [Spirochaetia bacterium]
MPGFAVPEEIRRLKPSSDSVVKAIGGKYYVYTYKARKLADGKWGTSTGKCIGKIIPGVGFAPNANYGTCHDDELTILEYGQYALLMSLAGETFADLKAAFPLRKAAQILAYSMILYANGFSHMDQVGMLYAQSWLPLAYRDYSFGMGQAAISSLLDGLGRKRNGVEAFERAQIAKGSGTVGIDGHVIRSCSGRNGLAEPGYKAGELKADQVNVLVALDLASERPLCTRVFRGSSVDKASVKDFLGDYRFRDTLFVVDRGFFSRDNLSLFSRDGNTYITPEPSNTAACRKATANLCFDDEFCCARGKTVTAMVQYRQVDLEDGVRLFVYRDLLENGKARYNYTRCLEEGKSGYTEEGLAANKELWGVSVLRTDTGLSAQEVYDRYKDRWKIETYYDYVKNYRRFTNLRIEGYYQEQGFAFIMLVVGLLHQSLKAAIKKTGRTTCSTLDAIIAARYMKLSKHGKTWRIDNKRKKDLAYFKKLGFEPELTL